MSIFKKVVKGLGFGLLVKALTKSKSKAKATVAAPLPTATRDDAATLIDQEDQLRRRKGTAADILTGTGGAEARLTGGKLILGN